MAVWVQVTVPADAAAGEYRGTLRVSAAGRKLADVPVELHVADWALPDPAKPLPPLHRPCWPRVAYFRWALRTSGPLMLHRLLPAEAFYRRLPGFSHACLDTGCAPRSAATAEGCCSGAISARATILATRSRPTLPGRARTARSR